MSFIEKESEMNSPSKKLDQSNQNSKGFSQQEQTDKKASTKNKAEAKAALQKDVNLAKRYLLENNTQKSAEISYNSILQNRQALGGENSILTLPGYFVLVEAKIAQGDLKNAEEFLIASYWTFLKYQKGDEAKKDDAVAKPQDDLTDTEYQVLNSNLRKTFCKMFTAQNELGRASDEIKETIFMDSQIYGPENIITSESYYLLGNIFSLTQDYVSADANYGIYISIWYKALKRFFHKLNYEGAHVEPLDSLLVKQAFYLLQEIQQYFDSKMDPLSAIQQYYYNKCSYSLALLYRLNENQEPFLSYLNKVLEGYKEQYGEDSRKVKKINEIFVKLLGSDYQDVPHEPEEEEEEDEQEHSAIN